MTSNIGLIPEADESDQPTIFGDLRKKLVDEFASEIPEFSDNYERLKVFLRVRPFTPEESLAQKQSCLSIEDNHYVTAVAPKESNNFKNNTHCGSKNIQKFKFSKIFREDDDQLQFYNGTVRSLVEDFLTGQNCLVFAYGVTNAGKTYTVQGNPKNPGVLPRTLETIFNYVNGKQWRGLDLKPKMFLDVVKLSPRSEHEERNKKDLLLRMASCDDSDCSSLLADSGRESCPLEVTERSQESDLNEEELLHSTQLNETADGDQIKYSVWVSFAEVYNEQVFDLLEVPNLKKRTLLKLGEDKHGNPYIRGLTEVNVTSAEEALKLMTIGQKNLRKASTKLNHNSSRSHCIFNIKLLRVVNRDNPCVAKVTTLSLCDLAGSERACKTNSTGDRLKEAGNINTSLLTLGRCIETMRSNQLRKDFMPRMIPYRDSKLTRLFQGFFSGRGKAVMIVNVNKCSSLFDETLQVFKFSAIAKQVVIQQKVEKPVSVTISPVLPVNPLSHMERASIPWADDVHEISRANYSHRLSTADETMMDEEITEREKGLLDIIDNCKKAITYLKESLAKEKKERMLDEIRIRDEITKELMEQFVAIEKNYSEKVQVTRLLAEEATDSKITKMLETLNPAKKRPHKEVEAEEEMVPIHVLQESQNKIKQYELQIQELTQRLESTKKQMRRMTTDNSKLACENTCLQFQVSDMLQIPVPQKATQSETLSDNLEQANVLSKLTSMLKSTQEKLKEKQDEASELEEQLQEAGETFHQNQQRIEELMEMVESLQQANKKPADCEACKARSENTWQLKPELKNQADNDVYQKYLMDFEERERALINGYNAEITKYKSQVSQLRLQLVHSKASPSHLSPTKEHPAKGTKEENLLNQTQIKQYLLRHVRRLQDELDKNSQSVAEVHQALELKKASENDLEQRLAYETAGHRQAKILISELKAKVKRLGERCRSASFEAEKTFAAIESELSFIENQRVMVKEQFSEQESFHSATESSFELAQSGSDNKVAGGIEKGSVSLKVIGGHPIGKPDRKTESNIGEENGSSFRLDQGCLEQKIINKNMEIVRLQEKLLVQSKLERDLKAISSKNEKLDSQLKAMSGFETELKKKASIIRGLEEKLKNTEILEVEIESQAQVIQHLQVAVNERSQLLAELQKNSSSKPTSPVSDRKLEEMEMVIADLREMVDRSTKELSLKDVEIQELKENRTVESLKNEIQSLKAAANSLEVEFENLKKEKEAFDLLKKTLENELETLKVKNASISESKNSLQKELENLNKKNKEMYNMKTTLEKNLEDLKLENKTINDLKNSLVKDFENLKAENKTISNLKNILEKDLEISKTEVKTILDLKNSLEKDLRNCEEEKNSFEKEIQILKEENGTILKEKESLNLKLLSVSSELDAKEKAMNERNNSLAFAKMAQKELEENLESKKRDLKAKDAELSKMSKLLEQKNVESEITVVCEKQDAEKCQVSEFPNELEKRKETKDNLQGENLDGAGQEESSLSQEPKIETLEELNSLKKSLEDNLQSKEKLLLENSNLKSLLTEKDKKITELSNGIGKEENTLKTGDEETNTAQLKADLDAEKQHCQELIMKLEMFTKEMDSLKDVDDQKVTALKMMLTTNLQCSQVKAPEVLGKKDSENDTKDEKSFVEDEKFDDSLSQTHTPQVEAASYDAGQVNVCVEKKTPCNLSEGGGGDATVPLLQPQSELQKVQNLLDAERSVNQTLRRELNATNETLDQLKTDYDNEKNVSFNLKYELDDVKGSLSEVLCSFDPSNQPRKEDLTENNKDDTSDKILQQLMEDMTPEKRKIVEDLNKSIKSWKSKYEESTLELISERQKLLDAQHSRSENFYLRQDNEKLQEKLSIVRKQLQEVESRQEIQLITMETDQMTKKLIEDRKKSEEQHLRDDLNYLRKELGAAQEKVKSYRELEAEVKQLRELIDKNKATPQEATVSINEVVQSTPHNEVRLDENERECDDSKRLKYEEMRREMEILSTELTSAQKEVQCLRDKVEEKDKVGNLCSTPLLNTKVGSNRQLRREKIEAENAKMKAEFALKIAEEEIQSLTKQLEKFVKKVSIGSTFELEKNAKEECLQLKDQMEENETKCSVVSDQTPKKLQKEQQELLIAFQDEKAKTSKLEDDLNQKRCVIGILKESLQKQEDLMIDFENLLLQKDEMIKNLNVELNEEKNLRQEDKENLPRPSLEKEQLKTVVTNQTETIQVLSQRSTQQEVTCATIRSELQSIKLSLSIVTAERDSLRKRLHLAETTAASACRCKNNCNVCPQKSFDATKDAKDIVVSNTAAAAAASDDDKYLHRQKERVMESIRKMGSSRRLEQENPSPKSLVGSPACETRRVKRTSSGPRPEINSCAQKKMCLSPVSSDQSPSVEEAPTSLASKGEYIEIDVTPPVAAKALKRNRKRKPLELPAQDNFLNSSKLSISTKSLSLCRRANVSDEEPSSGQEMPKETSTRLSRQSKSVAMKRIQQSSKSLKETSPINKRKKSVDQVKTTDDNMSDSKGKNALSRLKNLTSSFRSPSFRGAKNLLTSPRSWSTNETPKKNIPGSPKSQFTSSRAVKPSSSISKKNNSILNTSDVDMKRQQELHNILTDATSGPQRKRRLYKEEIIGPMSYESQIVKTRTITTVHPKEDVFSIVKQQLRGLRK